jgi:hypothetical protein
MTTVFGTARETRRFFYICLFLIVTLSMPIAAQTTATIVGTLADKTGAVVPGASITAMGTDTGLRREVKTNASGTYVIPALAVGEYSVTAAAPGFKRQTIDGVVLQVNQEARVDITLDVGALSESVTVSGVATLLQTETSGLGHVIDNRYDTQIPLNGRDFSQLILLVPGANARPGGPDAFSSATVGSNGSGFAIGGREALNNFMMDGASNNTRQYGSIAIRPSIDAVEEFKVQSNLYSAEFGQAAFGQINLVTKSGSNNYHGSLFEFLRNSAFDARNFFLPTVSMLKRNQFGGTVGGPIRKNKTFFFANYEGLRSRQGVDTLLSVPIDAWRQGNFSNLQSIKDPLSGAPFPNNQIPISRFAAPAVVALKHWPAQNFGASTLTANNLHVTTPDQFRDDQFTVKVDQMFSDNDHVMVRYSLADHWQETNSGMLPGFEYIDPPKNQVAVLSDTHIFSPRLLAEYHFSFTRSVFRRLYPNSGKAGVFEEYGINAPLAGLEFEGAPSFSFSGITLTAFGDSTTLPLNDISNEFTHAASATYTKGQHTLKAGVTFTWYQQNTPGAVPGNRRGAFSFSGNFTGNAFGDMLLGYPYQAQDTLGTGVQTERSTWQGYYINDDWKVSRKLTFNLGLRYEYDSPLIDLHNQKSTFWPITNDFLSGVNGQIVVADSPAANSVLGLSGTAAQALYRATRNNFAPRFGFAYTLRPNTVIRGGYGIFTALAQNFMNDFVINRANPPSAQKLLVTSSTTTPQINLADPLVGAGPAAVINTQNIDPNFRDGYAQQWNLTVQQQLRGGISLEAGYVANKGTHLTELPYYNIPLPLQPGDTRSLQNRRPFPQWGTVLALESYVNSNYNSLQVKVQKRFSHGVQFLASYTHAKSIDDGSERGDGDRGGFDGGDERNLRGYFRGLSGFDVRNRLVLSYIYELPFGKGKPLLSNLPVVADKIIGGWQLSGITQFQGGFPTSVLLSGDILSIGLSADRPDVLSQPVINPGNPNCYISDPRNAACGSSAVSAFVMAPAAQARFGNAGRNIIIGPGLKDWDANLSKNFQFSERCNLQFRAEFFNLMNNVNFNQPERMFNITSPKFGILDSAGPARQIQFGLKLAF